MSTDTHIRDMLFALECLDLEQLFTHPLFSDFSMDDIRGIIHEARKVSTEVVLPLNAVSDKEGARFHKKGGKVTTPTGYPEAFKLYCEGGWGNSSLSQKLGGIGLPESVAVACAELFIGACSAFTMAPGLTRSALDVIVKFGTDEQKTKYVPNMVSGIWTGTMCLTESKAGSDVGAITATATPIFGSDGRFHIRGEKTFISFGEHDLTENIVHLVLARTPGAPKGTKGISLFLVPKMKIGADGKTSKKKNDVVCGGIEHKMGIHGSPTCTLHFGDKNDCEGELIGTENRGMNHMFLMMNEARLAVGLQGMALGAAAYDAALLYAKERLQGSDIREFGNPNAPRVPIIVHHDVRQKLMTMKAHTEAMRALVYAVAHYIDMSKCASGEDERRKFHDWAEMMTPVVKAYCTDVGFSVADTGVQVFGGAGYCTDYPAEQFVRDAMILRIYEGTNGIQAIDLLMRKIPKDGGTVLMGFAGEMGENIEKLAGPSDIGKVALKLGEALDGFARLLMELHDKKMVQVALVNACAVLRVFGTIASAYYLLSEAAVASDKLALIYGDIADEGERNTIRSTNTEAQFYFSKIETAKFFVFNLLPSVFADMQVIVNRGTSCLKDVF